ncbi:holin family protein [Palleronia sp. LCG004]|uniref:holin family protein n=1 Tax=Palleronia sp. LCG004 TaxID=3079304 RepID=UPI002943AC2E|nr:holin family protein [Palleronia sp. LCG004]WOI57181.1 holin family protein [Palleronia sp. LCG004]
MGLIGKALGSVLGNGGSVVRDTIEVFRENAEAEAARDADRAQAALAQFASEFAAPRPGPFDRFMDGLNRLPRPAMAIGTIGLFAAAMIDPVWFGARMEGLALVPEPLWWLLGVIVSFYFGARYQAKGQEFKKSLVVASAAQAVATTQRIATTTATGGAVTTPDHNAALSEWKISSHDR